jgi:signal transduction histidine kinase/DNA-binding NarL/FixJ family response regulator
MENEKQKDRQKVESPRLKILIVLAIIGVTMAAVFYWSFNNYLNVTSALDEIALPNTKTSVINEVFQEIIEADSHFHIYILTSDTASESAYRKKMASVPIYINQLREILGEDSAQVKRIDSLQNTIDRKGNYLTLLLQLKKEKNRSYFTGQALNRISSQLGDTAVIEKELRLRETLVGTSEPVEREEIVITTEEYPGVSGFFKRIFGKQSIQVDTIRTIEEQISYNLNLSVDTNIVRDYFIDTTLQAVKDILVDVLADEIDLQRRLNDTELRIIRQDQEFIGIIRSLISELFLEEYHKNAGQKRDALQTATNATKQILVIGALGILLSGLFVVLILKDISKSHLYRQRLEEEKDKAEKLARVKEDFLSKMSHEIRTPLHNIIGFTELMMETGLDESQRKYLSAIGQSNSYLKELIDNVLEQAKIADGKLRLDQNEIDLVALANEIKISFEEEFRKKNLKFEINVAEFFNENLVHADPLRMRQILMNLVGNALKFTETGFVELNVNLIRRNKHNCDIVIKVIDSGSGVKGEDKELIFEQFEQGRSNANQTISGTGLGLSITRSLVLAMQGSIDLIDNESGGATFILMFNFMLSPKPIVESSIAEDNAESLKTPVKWPIHILVLEDDTWNARLIEEILKPICKEFKLFDNGIDALRYFEDENNNIDIIFSDINLPGMNGEEFLKKVRLLDTSIPVIALTAHIRESRRAALIELGFNEVCTKPFSKRDILDLVGKYYSGAENSEMPVLEKTEIDTTFLNQFAGNDPVVFQELLEEFSASINDKIRIIEEKFESKEVAAIGNVAHQLKSGLEQLKYSALSEALMSIELYAERGNNNRVLEETEKLIPALKDVQQQLATITHQSRSL